MKEENMSKDLPQRRRLVFGAVAACAGLGGAGLAWWQQRGNSTVEGTANANNAAQGSPGSGLATSKFWELAFEAPTGQSIAMVSLKGKPLLINFWATWCPPCVEELPLINRFYQENSKNGWQVLGLAVDQKSAVNGFLAKMPLNFPVALAGMSGVELSKSLGNLSGGLPFTVVVGSTGDVLHRKMGRISVADLGAWAQLK